MHPRLYSKAKAACKGSVYEPSDRFADVNKTITMAELAFEFQIMSHDATIFPASGKWSARAVYINKVVKFPVASGTNSFDTKPIRSLRVGPPTLSGAMPKSGSFFLFRDSAILIAMGRKGVFANAGKRQK